MRFAHTASRLLQVPLLANHDFKVNDEDIGFQSSCLRETSYFGPNFEALVKKSLHHFSVPGIAISIVDGDDTFSRGYGMAQFPDVPVTPETIFYGASTTKAFVAAALSLLVDDNNDFPHVEWRTPISELIPEDFVLEDGYSTLHVTLEDAATHRTGLPRHDLSCQGGNSTVRDVVRSMRFLPLTESLRTTFQYCNLMYIMLGHVIEILTGQWLGDFLSERIWKPLNMTSTYFSLSDALASGKPFAHGQYWLNESQTFLRLDYPDTSSTEGAGAVLSNVVDYAKWIRMMIDREPPISLAGHEALVSPYIVEGKIQETGSFLMYGYGWEIEQFRGYEIIHHNGADSGFGTTVLYIPRRRWGCVMMSNIFFTSNLVEEILLRNLVDELLEVPLSERVDLTATFDTLVAEYALMRNTTYVRELIYPPDKTGNVSASLPLQEYAGVYVHPGYGPWYISCENSTLWNRVNRPSVLQYNATLQHISSDNFLVVAYPKDEPEDPLYILAEFKVNVWGISERMGLLLEPEMGGEMIWFDRETRT